MTTYNAEYKIPGGKLLVAEFRVNQEKITNFELSGDFFLEPEEAREEIIAAVNGSDISLNATEFADKISAGVSANTAWYGISPEGVATVILRALGGSKHWRDLSWQIIRHDPLPAKYQVALDQIMTEDVGKGEMQPTLRIWSTSDSSVIIGSFQSVKNEVDEEAAKALGLSILRRVSGGGAMFMESDDIITYSLYLPVDMVRGMSFQDSYAFLDDWVLTALNKLGVKATYEPLNDITSPEGKIGGAAQKRLGNGGMVHHVTMSYDIDAEKMVQVLRIGKEKISDKGIASAKKRVDPLKSQTGLSRDEIIDTMVETFRELTGATDAELSEEYINRAAALAKEKFESDEWTYRIP